MSILDRLFGARRSRAEVVLYTRRGCHLCEVARADLTSLQRRWGFALTVRDVDDDPGWTAEYGEHVPVVTVGGTVRFRGSVNRVLMSRILRAEFR